MSDDPKWNRSADRRKFMALIDLATDQGMWLAGRFADKDVYFLPTELERELRVGKYRDTYVCWIIIDPHKVLDDATDKLKKAQADFDDISARLKRDLMAT